MDALLTRDIDQLTERVLKRVFEGENGSATGAKWQGRESLGRLQMILGRVWKEKNEREIELMAAIRDLTDQYTAAKLELQSAHGKIELLTQAQEAITAVHKAELDKRTRLSEDMRSNTYESLQAGQVAHLKGVLSGLEAQVTGLKLSLAAAIKEKTELRESLSDDFMHTLEIDLHRLQQSVEEALNYPREHAILRGLRADIISILARFDRRKEDKEWVVLSYGAAKRERRRGWRSESQGGLLPSEELTLYLSHMSHHRA